MNENDLQRSQKYLLNSRNFKKYSDKEFVNIDNGAQGGSHC